MKIFSSLVVDFAVLFLVLIRSCGGQSQVVGPSQPIVAMVGDDTMLPCHLHPAVDVASLAVEWSRADLNPRFVHVRRDGVELLIDQNPSYIGRTSVSADKLKCGDLSLKLSKVKLSDDGSYRCYIPEMYKGSTVRLVIGAVSSPVIRITKDASGVTLLLDCESSGWYPEPEVLWLDGEGKLLSAGPTETVRGPDDLYTVSSRVTVEKSDSNSFTCRVHQKDTNHTTETHITVAAIHNLAPPYLSDLLHTATSTRSLRSSSSIHLTVPPARLTTMGSRAFSRSAPKLWNSLPPDIRNIDSFPQFKSSLKTHLFRIAFSL
ncbi:butyrophilin-like protein 10 [Centropristis striata]|uniref:butyrophilin-like protein 10 n=1 Tax=Centropristis striata TaxID=184440 RepID=UPI0027DED1B1|nr:butyrophilin-like protein 10 [Centropristis striata]